MRKTVSAFLIIALILTLVVLLAYTLLCTGYAVHRDAVYGTDTCEVMDIYIPKKAYTRKENGCVLFIHGGSWSGGDKSEEDLRCRNVAKHGYIAATMNYTLHTEENTYTYTVDKVLDEIDMALEFIKNFCADMGVCVNKAATSGYSAGAHLSMLYSYSRGTSAPVDIKFTANMAGPADISPDIWGDELAMVIGERLSNQSITEEALRSGEADKILAYISPVSYINSDTPPSIFVYGGCDTTVSYKNGESLKRKFDAAGVEYEYIFLPDANHALMHNPIKRLSYPKYLIDYCDKYFK